MSEQNLTEKSQIFTESFQNKIVELVTGQWKPSEPDFGIAPVLTGEDLEKAVEKANDERTALIEGFIYEHNVIQIFADDGIGKSMAILNAMLQASSGSPVWNALPCPRPCRIIWNCAERPLDEPFERIRAMKETAKPDFGNMVFDKEIQQWDIKNEEGRHKMFVRMIELASSFLPEKPDIIVIDPIYAIVSGGLNGDEEVHLINQFLRKIQNYFGCAIVYLHHTNRGGRDGGKRVEGDMYGSRFLSANLTGQYHLKKTEDGVDLNCTKNTYGNLIKHIPLIYDELTKTLSMSQDADDLTKGDRVMLFLRKKHSEKKEFLLREISNQLKVSDAYIRKIIQPLVRSGHIVSVSEKGKKSVYKIEKGV